MAVGVVALVVLVSGIAFVLLAGRGFRSMFQSRTKITQAAVVQRLTSVARLITTEAAVRDVVTYQSTFLGSTKRSLVVVTGKAMVGFDLATPPAISVDQAAKRITIAMPAAQLISVDVTELRTYDERRGIWNPFRPADRDTIFLLARRQLASTARDLSVLEHAEDGARRFIEGLFVQDGYTVAVTFAAR